MIKKLYLALLAVMISLSILAPASVGAFEPFKDDVCRGPAATQTSVCTDGKSAENPISGSNGAILKAVNVLAFVAGAAAVIIIILASIRMISSGGSTDEVAGARRSVVFAAVGLVIIIFARTLVAFIIGKL